MYIEIEFTVDDPTGENIDVSIDWDTANPGSITSTHTALSADGVTVHTLRHDVPEARQYSVSVSATNAAGKDGFSSSTVLVKGPENVAPKIIVVSAVVEEFGSDDPDPDPDPDPNVGYNKNTANGPSLFSGPYCAPINKSGTVVRSEAEFDAAIRAARPGSVIVLQAGKVFNQPRSGVWDVYGVNGTAANPVHVTTSPTNPATINGGEAGMVILNSSHVVVSNIRIKGPSHWGIDIGGEKEGKGRTLSCHDIVVRNMNVKNTGIEGIMVAPRCYNIEISCNEISYTGLTTKTYGEGIYVGRGSGGSDTSHHVKIINNNIHHTPTEAVDIKHGTTSVEVLYNYIHDINVNAQGAITVGVDSVNYPDGKYKIVGNHVDGVTTRQYNGAGIVVGHGNTLIQDNLIKNVAFYGIYTQTNFKNQATKTVTVKNNTVTNAARGPWKNNEPGHGGSASWSCHAIVTGNSWQ